MTTEVNYIRISEEHAFELSVVESVLTGNLKYGLGTAGRRRTRRGGCTRASKHGHSECGPSLLSDMPHYGLNASPHGTYVSCLLPALYITAIDK